MFMRGVDGVFGMIIGFTLIVGGLMLFTKYWWVLAIIFVLVYLYERYDAKQEEKKWAPWNARVDRAAEAYWENRDAEANALHLADKDTRNKYYREFVLPRISDKV